MDERLQKLEKQRQSLEAKIQKEAQNKEIKAQKQAKAKEEKERKEREAQEKREAKQAQQRELREAKRQQIGFSKDESTALSGATSTSQESRQLRRTQSPQPSIYTNLNDRNGWFIALVPTVDVMFLYSNASSGATSYLFRFGAEYGATLEAGYLFGSGANAWRTYFSLGYGYGRGSDSAQYRYGYYYEYDSDGIVVDIHNITHNAGIDWIPRIGNSFARGVLGFYNSFSYMIMRDSYDLVYTTWVDNGTYPAYPPGGGYFSSTYLGRKQDFIHIFFIGIGTRLGVIFDIKEHFSIEIGSKISLHFSFLGANGNGGGLQFIRSVMPNFQQYLSFMYRF